MKQIIDQLAANNMLPKDKLIELLNSMSQEDISYLQEKALAAKFKVFGNSIYMRGLIEFTNYCRNDCLYCGIRAANKKCSRYRLSEEQIIAACSRGYNLGYRTFVLQGGEDPYYTDDKLTALIEKIKNKWPECALTLSIGERTESSYRKLFAAGANRFLLRHETKSENLYRQLHPNMSFHKREQCLRILKKIGFQTGAGFMVGLPQQTNEDYADDLLFLADLQPEMVGIGPFIPHNDTPLRTALAGSLKTTLAMLALTRLLLPGVLLPATTALGSIDDQGWEKGFKAGANVVMLNLSPPEVRRKYTLYNGKAVIPDEAELHLRKVREKIEQLGFSLDPARGDHPDFQPARIIK